MTENDSPTAGPGHHVNFDAPAILRKWPSLDGQRRIDSAGPYSLLDGTLDGLIAASWRSRLAHDMCINAYLAAVPIGECRFI